MTNPEQRLAFAKFVSTLTGKARIVAEAYPGYVCYKDIVGGHYWVQRYNDDGTIWLLHGRDSVLPGLDVPTSNPSELTDCGCDKWMPATAEQMRASRALAVSAVVAGMQHN